MNAISRVGKSIRMVFVHTHHLFIQALGLCVWDDKQCTLDEPPRDPVIDILSSPASVRGSSSVRMMQILSPGVGGCLP